MFNNRKDDDVIVITEEDVAYETPADSENPADSAPSPALSDQTVPDHSVPVAPDATGRFDAVTTPGDAAAAPVIYDGDSVGDDPASGEDPAAAPATAAIPATSAAAPAAEDSSWPQIQSLFVDDPHSAVRQAADVAGGALAALVAAARNREQSMRDAWQSDSTGTEDLRTALRGYRDLAGRLSALSRDL